MAIFNQTKSTAFNPQEINILNAGTRITGDLISEGDLRVDGSVKGNLEVKTKLVLGISCNVEGNIKALNCDVSGNVTGDIAVTELLTIKASAKVRGDISCGKLVIEAGAEFNGRSAMSTGLANGLGDYKTGRVGKPLETKAPVLSEAIREQAAV